jgi:hypothetical protein
VGQSEGAHYTKPTTGRHLYWNFVNIECVFLKSLPAAENTFLLWVRVCSSVVLVWVNGAWLKSKVFSLPVSTVPAVCCFQSFSFCTESFCDDGFQCVEYVRIRKSTHKP